MTFVRPFSRFTAATLAAGLGVMLSGCAPSVRSKTPDGTGAAMEPPPPPTYAPGVIVAGVDIGSATHERAAHLLRYHLRSLETRTVTLVYGDHAFTLSWKNLGIAPNVDAMLEKAWGQGNVPLEATVDLAAAKAGIRAVARELDISPRAPRLIGEPGKGTVKPGKTGRAVNVHNSALLLRDTITQDPAATRSTLKVAAVSPPFSEDELLSIRRPVVTFSTRFNPGEVSRTHNLRMVAERLNGALLRPGDTFSFNNWIGERRPEDGFREAIVFKRGAMVKETAGGLCQVSSTLYNVALLAGLPIVERGNHSLTINYVPLGRDATVYWGQRDLRFGNDTDMPLYIRAAVGRRTLTVEAWAPKALDRKVSVSSQTSWSNGKAYAQVYRTVERDGETRRERVSSDVYASAASASRPRN